MTFEVVHGMSRTPLSASGTGTHASPRATSFDDVIRDVRVHPATMPSGSLVMAKLWTKPARPGAMDAYRLPSVGAI